MLLKEKINEDVKGRACANDRNQRTYIKKEYAISLTACTEAVFLIALIEAYK